MRKDCRTCSSFSLTLPGKALKGSGYCTLECTCYDWAGWQPTGVLIVWEEELV